MRTVRVEWWPKISVIGFVDAVEDLRRPKEKEDHYSVHSFGSWFPYSYTLTINKKELIQCVFLKEKLYFFNTHSSTLALHKATLSVFNVLTLKK